MHSVKKICRTWKDVRELVSHIHRTKHASLDIETTSLKYYQPTEFIVSIAFSFQPGSAWVVFLYHPDSPFEDDWEEVLQYLGKEVLYNPEIVKIFWNEKFEYKWFYRFGIVMRGRCFDGMLAKHLLDEERPHGLKEMVARYLPEWAGYGDKIDKGKMLSYDLETIAIYNALDADLTFRLMLFFEPKLIRLNFYPLFRNLYNLLAIALGKCEYYGIMVDRAYLENLIKVYSEKIEAEATKLRTLRVVKRFERKRLAEVKEYYIEEMESLKTPASLAKAKWASTNRYDLLPKKDRELFAPLNLASPKQLIEFLYNSEYGLELPIIEYTKPKKGTVRKADATPSTAEETLLKLKEYDEYGFIDTLLEHRGLQKLFSTYIQGLYDILPEDDLLHCNYLPHGTVTGRLSSTEPNMQNIPRVTTNADIKGMFIAPDGYLLVELDYSQAELRIVAELAKEKKMIEYFQKGYNIHVAVAVDAENTGTGKNYTYEEIYPITKDESHPDHIYWVKRKKRAKTINFGILYEQGDAKLAETMNKGAKKEDMVTKQQAGKFKAEWFNTFPRIKKWINRQPEKAHEDGYVLNMWGFKRRLPNISSPNKGVRAEAERQSVNSPIQGASSFFTLFSAIVLEEQRMLGQLPGVTRPFVYTVHDSIGFYVRKDKIHEFAKVAVPIMANPQTMEYFHFKMEQVPMKASMELGPKWNELSDYSPKVDYTKPIPKKDGKKNSD